MLARRLAGRRFAAAVLCALLLCAASVRAAGDDPLFDDDDATAPAAGFPDPLESWNRGVLRANLALDRWFFDPLTRAYAFVVPAPGRRAVRRVLANLDSPSTFVNDLLQLDPLDAGVTITRMVVNSTAGIGGIFDVASAIGLEGHDNDFGRTLALAGVPSGPYLVLPVVGPTTARDGTGYVVDIAFRPTTYLLTPAAAVLVTSIHEGSVGIAARDEHAEDLRLLQASSVDYYAAVRNGFYQLRMSQIAERRDNAVSVAVR